MARKKTSMLPGGCLQGFEVCVCQGTLHFWHKKSCSYGVHVALVCDMCMWAMCMRVSECRSLKGL